jgi:hypothetical protein
MALTMRQSAAALRTRAPAVSSRRSALVVRASAENKPVGAPSTPAAPAAPVQNEVAFEAVPKVQAVPVAAAVAASPAAPSLFGEFPFGVALGWWFAAGHRIACVVAAGCAASHLSSQPPEQPACQWIQLSNQQPHRLAAGLFMHEQPA